MGLEGSLAVVAAYTVPENPGGQVVAHLIFDVGHLVLAFVVAIGPALKSKKRRWARECRLVSAEEWIEPAAGSRTAQPHLKLFVFGRTLVDELLALVIGCDLCVCAKATCKQDRSPLLENDVHPRERESDRTLSSVPCQSNKGRSDGKSR